MFGPLHALASRCRDLVRRRHLEEDLSEEIRVHLEMQAEARRASGVPAEEAERDARRQLGDLDRLKEQCRDEWSFVALEQLRRDCRFAAGALAKSRGFALAVVATLAGAIGAAAAIVHLALQVLQPTLPYPDPATLLAVQEYDPATNEAALMTAAQFAELRLHTTIFARLAALHPEKLNLVDAGRPAAVNVGWVTEDFFGAFGMAPTLGRTFEPGEFLANDAGAVAVLTHGTWMAHFGGSPTVVGRTIQLGDRRCRIVGVMPESFRSPIGFPGWDVFLPTTAAGLAQGQWWQTLVWSVGRLKPGIAPAQARTELTAAAAEGTPPTASMKGVVPRIEPIRSLYGTESDRVIAAVLIGGGFLYTMACANAFNLVLMRTVGRRAELSMRAALGGSRSQLFQMLAIENLFLVGAAGMAAGLLAHVLCLLFVRSVGYWWPSAGPIAVHGAGLWSLVALATLGAVVLVGILPAWRAARAAGPGGGSLRLGALHDGRRLRRWRAASAVAQAAMTVILLVGATLCGRALFRLLQAGMGFDPVHRIAVVGQLPPAWFTLPPRSDDFLALAGRLQQALVNLPGVERAAVVSRAPLSGRDELGPVRIDGRTHLAELRCEFNSVSPDYFDTLGLRLLRGRGFTGMAHGDPEVVVINEAMAREWFPGEDPVGLRLDVGPRGRWHTGDGRDSEPRVLWEIIGVASDVRDADPRVAPRPRVYLPLWQRSPYDVEQLNVLLKLAGAPPSGFAAAVRQVAFTVEPNLVISEVALLEERAAAAIWFERHATAILGVMSLFALAMAGLGLGSILSGLVAERRQEFGVRLALGATSGELQRLVLCRGLQWTGLGIALGLGVSWAAMRVLQVLLYATSPHDPVVFVAVACFVLAVAAFACWWPARRVATIDPMVALRAE